MMTSTTYPHADLMRHATYSARGPALLLLALAFAFFARLLTAAGAPSVLNFTHFGMVLLVSLYYITVPLRLTASTRLLGGLYGLFVVIVVSALVNGAGLLNTVLEWLLLGQPFLLLAALSAVRWTPEQTARFRWGLFLFAAVHAVLAFAQYASGLYADAVKGVFLEQGAGHHVGGAVALTAALYFFVDPPERLRRMRYLLALGFLAVVFFSDTKQAFAAFLVAGLGLILIKQGAALRGQASAKRLLRYLAVFLLAVVGLFWAANSFFPALSTWADTGRARIGLEQKMAAFPILTSHFDSGPQWAVGLGPGHTVGRLGLLIPNYQAELEPLGVTTHPATQEIVLAKQSHWISRSGSGSSIWSPTFSYAGIWGDLGTIGLLVYLGLWLLVWVYVCPDDLSRFLLLTVLVFGAVFTWLEEPAYTLIVASLIGLRYQEHLARLDRES